MVSRRLLKPTSWHYAVRLMYGNVAQIKKVIEELEELNLALAEGDKEHITEEVADVELVLPYIKIAYDAPAPFLVEHRGRMDYGLASKILIRLLELKLSERAVEYSLTKAIEAMAQYICCCLADICHSYSIKECDVDRYKEEKMRRTVKRTIKKMIGVES